jgi:large subunit ribosomal protein L16
MKNEPKNLTKFKKTRKGKLKKVEYKSNTLKFGKFGLKAAESGFVNFNQIESCRNTILRKTNRKVKIWLKLFFYSSITSKPIGTRMGKGKGKIISWASKLKKGALIFEISGLNKNLLLFSLKSCQIKFPIKTKICKKNFLWLTKIIKTT